MEIFKAPDDRGVCQLLNVYIIMSSWVPPLLRESSPAICDFSVTQRTLQVILYGVCLALYTWRIASRPREPSQASQIDGEMGGVEPGLHNIAANVPRELSSAVVRHSVSEDLLSSIAGGTSSSDSRRGSARKSRLEKRLPDHFF